MSIFKRHKKSAPRNLPSISDIDGISEEGKAKGQKLGISEIQTTKRVQNDYCDQKTAVSKQLQQTQKDISDVKETETKNTAILDDCIGNGTLSRPKPLPKPPKDGNPWQCMTSSSAQEIMTSEQLASRPLPARPSKVSDDVITNASNNPLSSGRVGRTGKMQQNSLAENDRDKQLKEHRWYFGDTTRELCEKYVLQQSRDGAFALRKSIAGGALIPYTLTILYNSAVHDFHISYLDEGTFTLRSDDINDHVFESVTDLITFYRNNWLKIVDDNNNNTIIGSVKLMVIPNKS